MTQVRPSFLPLRYAAVPPERRRATVESLLALQGEPAAGLLAESLLRADRGRSTGALIEALSEQTPVGCCWGQVHAGRSATVWPPSLEPGEPEDVAVELIEKVCDALARQNVVMAQSLLRLPDVRDGPRLARAGFVHLADLLYLAAAPQQSSQQSSQQPPEWPLEFDVCDASDARLVSITERTYEATMDCPSLSGLRSIADILAGYRETGRYMPQWWFVARCGNRDVGCVLLADHPQSGVLELVYMGLVRECRGKGLGRELLRHALWVARQSGRRQLLLAVDRRNIPAARLYDEAGFVVWTERRAVMRHLSR
jgi:GNAT superfamily N-acetyltransferase